MKVKVISKGLNLRSGSSTDHEVVFVLKKGDVLDVKSDGQIGWLKVSYGIYKGYVNKTYVENVTEEVPHIMTMAERSLLIARSQLGVSEKPVGSNWGTDIKKYLNSVGIDSPNPWCMAFVYWCVNESCKEMKMENPLKKTGGVLDQWNNSLSLQKDSPSKGDIFIMNFGKGKGHTGFVSNIVGDTIHTIEGNSNDEGSREGYEVCRKPGGRKISSCIGFIRLF